MKAVRLHERGGPERIVVEDAPRPEPGVGEVRIRVRAAAITPGELSWDQTYQHADGTPRLPTIPGHDAAGTVDALGAGVDGVLLGQAVYALIDFPRDGSAAEYVIVPAGELAVAPAAVDLAHAAAVPVSGLTAWQALFDHGQLTAGQRVLVHGGAGGVGGFAIQLARAHGARVIATASPANLQRLRDRGAQEVIDYTAGRFEDAAREVDLVFDAVGGETLSRSFAALRRGGRLISITAPPDPARAADAGVTARFFIVRPDRAQLQQLAVLIDAGKLQVNIQDIFPLAEARRAFERSLEGKLTGKVILRVD